MTTETKRFYQKAMQRALDNERDGLARAQWQEQADPTWDSGDGESIYDVIAEYEATIRTLEDEIDFLAALELGFSALAKLVRAEWPDGQTLAHIALVAGETTEEEREAIARLDALRGGDA